MKQRLALFGAVLMMIARFALAQESQPGQSEERIDLSLQRACDLALAVDGNVRLRLAQELIRQTRARSKSARAELLPHVGGQVDWASYTRNLRAFGLGVETGTQEFPIPDLVGPFEILDLRGQASQMIFDFGSIRRYQASRTAVDAARAEEERIRDQTLEEVARAYLTGLRSQALRDTAAANVTLAERLLQLAETQKRAGTATGIELTRARVELASEEQSLAVAEHQLESALLQLQKVIRLKLSARIQLTDRLAYKPIEDIDTEEALKQAQALRADWKAQVENEKNAEQLYSAARWNRLPSLRAFGDYGTIGIPGDSLRPTRTFGISASIPIFDGGRMEAEREEAHSMLEQEKVQREDLMDTIELQVRIALDSLRSAEAQVKVAGEGIELAENELEQAERRYRAGVATNVEVVDAQTRLQRARSNRVEALFNHNLARLDLKVALGRIREIIP